MMPAVVWEDRGATAGFLDKRSPLVPDRQRPGCSGGPAR
jgi:hypothetical protein